MTQTQKLLQNDVREPRVCGCGCRRGCGLCVDVGSGVRVDAPVGVGGVWAWVRVCA